MATLCFPKNARHTCISDMNFLPTEKGITYPGKYAGVFLEVATVICTWMSITKWSAGWGYGV